jgi:NTE family protein
MSASPHHPHPQAGIADERALVLGGGGSAGNAWLIGVVAGLCASAVDVSAADLIVGTSAGATAAAQIAGSSPDRLLAEILAPQPGGPAPRGGTAVGPGRSAPPVDHMARTGRIIGAAADPAEMRRELGASARELAAMDPSWQSMWRATVASRLPGAEWPGTRILITAVDATSGEPVVFDRRSGVSLVDAVAASCSSGPAYDIAGTGYIDGGYRANADNADVALGFGRVLVLSPFAGRSRTPATWGLHLADQVESLQAHGSRVEVVFPDEASVAAFGDSMMDPSTRPPAARAGYDQGLGVAERVRAFWR